MRRRRNSLGRSRVDCRPSGSNPLHLSRGTAWRPASGLFQPARMATNLPLFPCRLQLPVLVTVRSVCVRLSRTIQGPKSQPESCFGRMCLSPEKQRARRSEKFPNRRVQEARCGRNPRPTASKIVEFRGDFGSGKPVKPTASTGFMERAMGIEPMSEAWEVLRCTSFTPPP